MLGSKLGRYHQKNSNEVVVRTIAEVLKILKVSLFIIAYKLI